MIAFPNQNAWFSASLDMLPQNNSWLHMAEIVPSPHISTSFQTTASQPSPKFPRKGSFAPRLRAQTPESDRVEF